MAFLGSKPEKEQSDLFVPALIVFFTIYLAQTFFVGWFLIDWRHWNSAIFFFGFEVIFIGIAYDITESLFAIFATSRKTPHLDSLTDYPPVALVMTVCDDGRPSRWATLKQDYPNCDIFILDDSTSPHEQSLVDQSKHVVIRRPQKSSYKAGNLNYWLKKYGRRYKFFVILDSDSLITPDFVEKMVAFAEHPSNERIAVFQSLIYPVDAETVFSEVLGSMSKLRFYIFSRFANRTGFVLSWGHNQLLRTQPILEIGGFCEEISPEDSTLTLALSQLGYSVRLVDVASYDTDPPHIFAFMRRIVRWAGQTAEVFSMPWEGASFRLKLLLCQHLYTYTVHNIYIALLLYTAWGFDSRGISALKLFQFISNNIQGLWLWTVVLAEMSVLWLVQFSLRTYLAYRAGISLKDFLRHTFLATALHSFIGLAVDYSILKVLLGKKIDFKPTNAKNIGAKKDWSFFMADIAFWFFVGGSILLGMSLRNHLLFYSLNGLWIFFWAIAPFTLLLFHWDQLLRG